MTSTRSYTVLQLLPALDTGGVERTVIDLSSALQKAGHQACVVSAGGRLVPELLQTGAHHYTLPIGAKSPATLFRRVMALRALINKLDVDLVHAHSRVPAWIAHIALRRYTRFSWCPMITTYHGIYNQGWPGKRRYNAIMARGDRVIANSNFTRDHILKTHGTAPERIAVIPRGIDVEEFDPARVEKTDVQALRLGWRVKPDQTVILLPARLTGWKGQRVAIDALAALPARYVLVCLGDAQGREDYKQSLLDQAKTLGIADRVVLPGHATDMALAYAAADLVVNSSTDPESFGYTVIEAQAMGRWVIASAHGGPLETVRDGQTGTLFRPGDAGALAQAIKAAPDEVDTDFMRGHILENYSKRMLQERTLSLYSELMG